MSVCRRSAVPYHRTDPTCTLRESNGFLTEIERAIRNIGGSMAKMAGYIIEYRMKKNLFTFLT